jgi:hypothetical protein
MPPTIGIVANNLQCSQRAFRLRKEQYLKSLEERLGNLEATEREAAREHDRLQEQLRDIMLENNALREACTIRRNLHATPGTTKLARCSIFTHSQTGCDSERGESQFQNPGTWEDIVTSS